MSDPGSPLLELNYDRGSLVLQGGFPAGGGGWPEYLNRDERIGGWRCLALHYRALITWLTRSGLAFRDQARQYGELPLNASGFPEPFPHQSEALAVWRKAHWGMIELPTGAGKTQLALLAMAAIARDTLILVPTLDLMAQWSNVLESFLGVQPGMIGGGRHDLRPVTVSTYASAYRKGEHFGHRFGLAIFDECHHLGGEGFAHIAEILIAPYRIGLSATVERPDNRHRLLDSLIGPVVYRRSINELSGRYLADYRTEIIEADLTPQEREEYEACRRVYLDFAHSRNLAPSSGDGWRRFVFAAARSQEGREALEAYRRQRRIALTPASKLGILRDLLLRHRAERVLIFTNDNRTAYEIAQGFLLPIITHQTRISERRTILENFKDGHWPFLVTSRVLNEGVDVPTVNVAVVVSGTASVREHVQRLGRILRRAPGKEAVLYEILSSTPGERSVSRRRREHDAYR